MNRDQIEGKWSEIKGRLQAAYGELTDDELKRAKGDREKLEGYLQTKLGDSKENVRAEVDKILASI